MTPAGLLACGSVWTCGLACAALACRPVDRATVARAAPTNASLMATNIDQPGAADVAKPLLFGDGLRVPQQLDKDAREGSIWPLIGPTVLVLALLVLATAYAGAFNIAQWGPPTLFIVLTLFTLLARDGLRAPPDRWLGLTLAGAWGLAGWAVLSALW